MCTKTHAWRAVGVISVLVPCALVAAAVSSLNNQYETVYPEHLDRLRAAVAGRCQAFASEGHAGLAHLANTSASSRCQRSVECTCDRSEDGYCHPEPIEDWDAKNWDGDRGVKVRGSTDLALQGAVECPCTDPGMAAGVNFAKSHQNGAALILMRTHALKHFDWSASECVHVHWFRGSNTGGQRISDKVLQRIWRSRDRHQNMDLETWVSAGELDCFAIRAEGMWKLDDLFINAKLDGLIKTIEIWQSRGRLFGRLGLIGGMTLLVITTCSLICCRPRAIGRRSG